jgi:hypothetical protein
MIRLNINKLLHRYTKCVSMSYARYNKSASEKCRDNDFARYIYLKRSMI